HLHGVLIAPGLPQSGRLASLLVGSDLAACWDLLLSEGCWSGCAAFESAASAIPPLRLSVVMSLGWYLFWGFRTTHLGQSLPQLRDQSSRTTPREAELCSRPRGSSVAIDHLCPVRSATQVSARSQCLRRRSRSATEVALPAFTIACAGFRVAARAWAIPQPQHWHA